MARPTLSQVYLNRRMAALLGLGFASGLPLMLTRDSMTAWLQRSGVNVKNIGIFALVGLPYSLKFLWAPLMDRYSFRLFGRRRGWLILTQLLCIVAIIGMGGLNPDKQIWLFAAAAWLVALASASQDIVADAYRTDVLAPEELGAGAGVFVNGYRAAMIVAGGGAMLLVARWGWDGAYLWMAGLMSVGLIATLFAPEPATRHAPPATLTDAVVHPLREFLARTGAHALAIICFVLLFQLPDIMAGWQTLPFLLKLGYDERQIGLIRQWLGIGITMLGALAGGGIVARMGLLPSLWVIGIMQALSNAGFLLLAFTGPHLSVLVLVIAVESFCGGLVTAGFMAYLMSQCNQRFSATQYALLTSLMALTGVIFRTPTGYLVTWLGWPGFFALTIAFGLPGMAMLFWLPKNQTRAFAPQPPPPPALPELHAPTRADR